MMMKAFYRIFLVLVMTYVCSQILAALPVFTMKYVETTPLLICIVETKAVCASLRFNQYCYHYNFILYEIITYELRARF